MIRFDLDIDGEAHTVSITPLVARKWEKRTGQSISSIDAKTELSDVYLLAYLAAVQAKVFTGTLDEFEDVADFDDAAPEEDPLVTAQEA